MQDYRKLIAIAALAILGSIAAPAEGADPKPPTNDFILRAPATEVSGIASRNGLTVVSEIAAAVDEDGHGLYLVRAASSALPELVIDDVETLEPEAADIEEVFLASLPKLNQSTAVILDTSTVDNALGAVVGFPAPSALVDATWNDHLHDRELDKYETREMRLEFENPADGNPAGYALQVNYNDGSSGVFDPANTCQIALHSTLDAGGSDVKLRLINLSGGDVHLDTITLDWPAANGDLIEVKLGGKLVYEPDLAPASATITSGWSGVLDDRKVEDLKDEELKLKFLADVDPDPAGYTLTVTTAEGHAAAFAAPGSECIGQAAASGNAVTWRVANNIADKLLINDLSVTWPAANGKLLIATLDGDSLIDAPYYVFGEDTNGDDRLVWTGYLNQPAVQQLEVDEAQNSFRGDATVAILDTGIDPDHPLLADRIVPGYDFVNDVAGTASEMGDLDQSTAVILDQSTAVILDQSTAVILDQSTAVILDQSTAVILDTNDLPPTFGHGTMVAGVIHRVAPEAKLMPLKVFDANGHASVYDIVEAIYYAVDHGANVIQMSFSLEAFSPELMRAVNYAARHGVACVASAGNLGEEMLVFPAALGNTIGVASTADDGELSAFSNWGSDLVTIAAPGENIVTTYPGGRWALASGTSFSAPWISGAAALFADKLGTKHAPGLADYYLSSHALADADPVSGSGQGKVGHGRAKLKRAIDRVKSGRYASDRPLGTYTITATFAEGCTASYPPPSSGGGCSVDGAGQLKFDGKKLFWNLTNEGEAEANLDSITIAWESDNGELRKVEIDGQQVDDVDHPAASTTISSGWEGLPEDRVWAPHQTREILFEFEHNVVWTY